jgi:S-formylglutathione hydrolase FrmB
VIHRRRVVAVAALLLVGLAIWAIAAGAGGGGTPDARGLRIARMTIDSKAVGEKLPVSVVIPRGGARHRPLLVFLHGRGEDEDTFLDDQFLGALRGLGRRAPVVAFPYGGEASYWHDRADGDWGRYVTGEVIPAVSRRFGADPRRVAIGGISMGGFGAYDLARLHPGRFCAVGGHSPALWQSGAETAPGAFDDAEDFARHDVVGSARADVSPYTSQPDWIDAGAGDPFRAGDEALIAALRAADAPLTVHLDWAGGHDTEYWNSHWRSYLRFYAAALAEC